MGTDSGVAPVYKIMTHRDVYDITLISVIDALINILMDRNQHSKYRVARLTTMKDKIETIEKSYEGYIPDNYINRSEKFLTYLHSDLASLLKDIPKIRG